jgi:hypothetical protein
MKGELAKDPRWQTELLSEKDKERLFRAYVKELANIEKEKKKKREREEAARREREETVRRMKEEQFVKMGRERKKLQRDEEVNNFRALLSERIHDPEARWDEWKRKLASDKRWNAYSLSEHDKERLFEDYIKSIEESREKEFLKCLQSNPKIELNTTWEVAREVLKDELPFKTIANEKWKESIFERHIRDLQQRATDAFLRLLRTLNEKETRLEGPPGKEHLPRSTMDFLRGDKRWKRLDVLPEKRQHLLSEFIAELRARKERLERRAKAKAETETEPKTSESEANTNVSKTEVKEKISSSE